MKRRRRWIAWVIAVALSLSLAGGIPVTASGETAEQADAGTQTELQTDSSDNQREEAQNGTEMTAAEKKIAVQDLREQGIANTASVGQQETGRKSVTVYFTLSEDGNFVMGNDQNRTLLSRVPVTVDYFDLADYGLSDFYRYESEAPENGGEYVGDEVLQQPTVLHLYIRMLEQYYLGGQTLQVGGDALTITGSATSMYMKKFWGHDENLMYFVDHTYPLMRAGWGATADYILLEEGMEIDVAMFSNWNFYNYGAFADFTPTEKSVETGENFTLTMRGASTMPASEEAKKAMAGEDVVYAYAEDTNGGYTNEYWEVWPEPTDDRGQVTMSFDEPGTYYISSTPLYNTFQGDDGTPCVAPPIATITVTGDGQEEDTTGTDDLTILSDLYFTSGTAASSARYEMTPAFDAGIQEYTVTIPDCDTNIALWSKKTEAAEQVSAVSRMKAVYRGTDGTAKEKEKKAGESSGLALTELLQQGEEGASVEITVTCGNSSQSYRVNIERTPTIAGIQLKDADGNQVSLTPAFSGKETEYAVSVPVDMTHLTVQPAACDTEYGSGYTIAVNGSAVDGTERDVVLSGDESPEEITVEVTGSSGQRTVYTLTVNKRKWARCIFTDLISGTVIQVTDSRHKDLMKTSAAETTVMLDKLAEGESYTYRLTKKGYVGKTGTITAGSEDISIDGALEKARINATINTSISSVWPNFRGNLSNNGLTAYPSPIKAADTILYWAVQNGGGWSGAPSSPILVGEDLVFSTNTEIIKVDRMTGEVKQRGEMVSKSAFSLTPPTYADGMIFIALTNGRVQAFNADTLESLWVYQDALKGQPNSPITYYNGYLYTGFWNSETGNANMVCLTATDEDVNSKTEQKTATWTHMHTGGFYWAGAYADDSAVIVGSDNGTDDESQETGVLYSFHPETGAVLDRIDQIKGDIRSTVVYDEATDRCYFTSRGGGFYSVKVNEDGTFEQSSITVLELGGQSTSTPVIYRGRAYVGVSGSSSLGAYSGHSITVIDLADNQIAYRVETRGYPQASGLLTTGYESADGYAYLYFIENYTPGIVRIIKDKAGQTEPIFDSANSGILGEGAGYADTLFTPRGEQSEYAIGSPVADEYGTIYFKNDSAYMMALGSRIEKLEVTQPPDKTEYSAGESFDPKGMVVTACLANGLKRDVTDYISYAQTPLTDQDLEVEVSFRHALYNDKEKNIDPPSVYVSISSFSDAKRAEVRAVMELIQAIPLSASKEAAVKKAREAYDALGPTLQQYVKNKDMLVRAETEIANTRLNAGKGTNPTVSVSCTSYNTLKVTWSRNSNADGYEIYRSTSASSRGSRIKTITTNTVTSLSNSGLTTGQTYYYTVRPYIKVDGSPAGSLYFGTKSGKTHLTAAKAKAASTGYRSIKLTWSKVNGATGYKIYRSKSKSSGYTLVKTLARGTYSSYVNTSSSLVSGTKYYYKVRAYRGSAYADSPAVYAVPKPSAVTGFKVTSGKRKATVSWKKVSGASGYVVYRATKAKGKYKAVKTIKKGSTVRYTNSKLKKGRVYYYKVRAYRTVKGKRVYGAYSAAKRAKIR